MEVEIFKTCISTKQAAYKAVQELQAIFPHLKCNVDTEEPDHILRVAGENIQPHFIAECMRKKGYLCDWINEEETN